MEDEYDDEYSDMVETELQEEIYRLKKLALDLAQALESVTEEPLYPDVLFPSPLPNPFLKHVGQLIREARR
jgi:hypothetical protein